MLRAAACVGLLVCVGLVSCLTEEEKIQAKVKVTAPPGITHHPPKEVAFKDNEEVKLICNASGEPRPKFFWLKNGTDFIVDGRRVKMIVDQGTLVFLSPMEQDEGIYQCIANNTLGKALSVKAMMKKARGDPFKTVIAPKSHKPNVRDYLKLTCNPPYSYPTGLLYWGLDNPGSKFTAVDTNASHGRISLDYEGNLHFAHVEIGDSKGGKSYICISENVALRSLAKGSDQTISPETDGNEPSYIEPNKEWNSESPTVGIKGQSVKMKCIFSGFPTPVVSWRRADGKPLQLKAKMRAWGQELYIPDLQIEDSADYQCYAHNAPSKREKTFNIQLTVETEPYWMEEPRSQEIPDEDVAEFTCRAGGIPPPFVTWMRNGQPIDEIDNPRREIINGGLTVRYNGVNALDAGVLQCNASNKHGYSFTNAYLNVKSYPPTFITLPQKEAKVAEGKDVTITCEVYGAPRPKITWFHDMDKLETDRFIINTSTKISGNLTIKKAEMDDQGMYRCLAENKFGSEDEEGYLLVRKPTVILEGPGPLLVNASDEFTLPCEVQTDPEEEHNLRITWYLDDDPIDYNEQTHMTFNDDNSLTVKGATVEDTGEFKCSATNGLDTTEQVAEITVRDRPNRPQDIWFDSCGAQSANLQWLEAEDNSDPITAYIVFYNTSFMEPDVFTELDPVSGDETLLRVELSPWMNYTFHVRAENSMGRSDRSPFTVTVCETPPSYPIKNPENVCSLSRGSDELVITWEPMPRVDHNGPDFHYDIIATEVVSGIPHQRDVYDWEQSEVSIPSEKPFTKYEVTVRSVNKMGSAPAMVEKIYAYSGEETPVAVPENFALIEESLTDDSANFTWTAVDESDPDLIKGHFTGYRVVYWRADAEDDKRHTDLIMSEFNPCEPVEDTRRWRRGRRQAQDDLRQVAVTDLWPYDNIQAAVLVLNGGKQGQPSGSISLKTLEGPPGPAQQLIVTETGSYHIVLKWLPPLTLNGVLQGYLIKYKEADKLIPFRLEPINDPTQLSYRIDKLEPDTDYVIEHLSRTGGGLGTAELASARTKPMGAPDKPHVAEAIFDPEENMMNLTIAPTSESDPEDKNPGNDFYVHYKKKGDDEWFRIDLEPGQTWANFSAEEGEEYEVVVVAVSGYGDDAMETRSDPTIVKAVGPKEDGGRREAAAQPIAKAGWFWGMLLAILFLLIILLIVCCIYRNRGGKYPVYEKEKLRGRPEDDEEGNFGEYNRPSEASPLTPKQKSAPPNGNIDEVKPLGESESDDSMAEYEDTDPSKFNEDGSFIGLYGGSKVKDDRLDQSNALSTVV